MTHKLIRLLLRLRLALFMTAWRVMLAQTAPSGAGTPMPDDVVELSQFTVSGAGDRGYNTANTVGATRINSEIKNTPISVVVINQQFIQDLGATDPYYTARFVSGVSGAGSPNSGQMTLRGQNTQVDMGWSGERRGAS